jgi:hypothetical protein
MTKRLLILLAGIALIAGCAMEHPSAGGHVSSAATPERSSSGPSLKNASLKMSEDQLLDILHRQKIPYTRDVGPGQTMSYFVHPKAGAVVIFMFTDGHCSGIQRGTDAGF